MKTWKIVVRPKTGLFDLPMQEIWQYRSLIFMLVSRNYKIQYKQTILGPGWILISPILSSGIFSFVFGYVGQFSSDGLPYFLFYMSASILWALFTGCITSNSGVFLNNAYLFGKVYFPRLVVPISNAIFEILRFAIQFAVFILVWLYFFLKGEAAFTGGYLFLVPVLILMMAIMGMSFGIIISSLTIKYRDLTHCVGLGIQLLMYASPILYPITQLPKFLQKLVLLNPAAPIIEAFRFVLTGSGTVRAGWLCYSGIFIICLACSALVLFNQTEKTFIDIV